jgi:hypothetical protein
MGLKKRMKGLHPSLALAVAFSCMCFAHSSEPSNARRITGRVVDPLKQPLKGITVTAADAASKNPTIVVHTDDAGGFVFSLESAAVYELRFETPGFRRHARTVAVANNADVDLGSIVMEVAPIEEPINIPTVASELPTSLTSAGRSGVPGESARTSNERSLAVSRSEVIGVCEALRRLKTMSGQMVSLRGEFHFTSQHGGWLLDEQAKGKPCGHMPKESRIWWSAIWLGSANDPNPEDGTVNFREEPPTFDDLIRRQQNVQGSDDGQILVVTILGQIRTKKDLKIVRAPYGHGDTMGNGYGVGGAYPALLVVKTVRDVQVH